MFSKIIQGTISCVAVTGIKAYQNFLIPSLLQNCNIIRYKSITNRKDATQLWKGVTGVSNAGRQRGRAAANRRARSKDLNRGQRLGVGNENIVWPGLNTPIVKGSLVKHQRLPPDPSRLEKLLSIRNKMIKFRRYKLTPLERGFSGHSFRGRKIGPPDPIMGESFDGFESIVLELKFTCRMDGVYGRVRGTKSIVCTGNGKGIIGVGMAESPTMMACINKAKNACGQNLIKVNIENGSIPGSFVGASNHTKVLCQRVAPGNGLTCSRIVAAICKLAGIDNIRAKIMHSRNPTYVIKAFVQGLALQKSHQELADQKRLNIIDISGSYPVLITKPKETIVRKKEEILEEEELDLDLYTFKGVHLLKKKLFRPAYTNEDYYLFYMKKLEHTRYNYRIKQRLFIEHGEIKSFMDEKFNTKRNVRSFQVRHKHKRRVLKECEYRSLKGVQDKHMNVTSSLHIVGNVYK